MQAKVKKCYFLIVMKTKGTPASSVAPGLPLRETSSAVICPDAMKTKSQRQEFMPKRSEQLSQHLAVCFIHVQGSYSLLFHLEEVKIKWSVST